MAQVPDSKCSHCGEPATNKCLGCGIHVYCGKDCQTLDWPTHKAICKELCLQNAVERAVDTIQKVYLDFRENTFDNLIIKVEVQKDQLILYYGESRKKPKGGFFAAFPNHLIEDRSVKNAALCTLMANEPLAFLHEIIAYLLKGKRKITLCL